MEPNQREALRRLPSVDEVLGELGDTGGYSHGMKADAVRSVLEGLRQQVLAGDLPIDTSLPAIVQRVEAYLYRVCQPSLKRVINATGVILHTNLGRAVLSPAARQAVERVTAGYCNLEMDLATGTRGSRYHYVVDLLCKLTGAEAALVVNNNAAAVLLALAALARDREVIVSRGQLVEIGGSFRVPEVMVQSGARLVEVGTTNKTYIHDYRRAVTPETALFLKVHTSNYRVVGFTHETTLPELVQLGREKGIPVMEDLGSGMLLDLKAMGIGDEPTVQESVRAGADLVTFSGDKLLGGPQAGIVVGRGDLVAQLRSHPLTRALRVDKMTLAALEATLLPCLNPEGATKTIPTLRMLTMSMVEVRARAQQLADALATLLGDRAAVAVSEDFSEAGGGSLPTTKIATVVVTVQPAMVGTQEAADRLRRLEPSVVVRIRDNRIVIDPRTLMDDDIGDVVKGLAQVCGAKG